MNGSFRKAIEAFDTFNSTDPNQVDFQGNKVPKELLYAQRMSNKLSGFKNTAPEPLQLAVRCQHIGRWQIQRDSYPEGQKGYFQWRNALKIHHAGIAERILTECGYEAATIEKVKFLLMKKQLHHNADTQLLEDVVCLVFMEYYLDDFAIKHEAEKVVDILKKTMLKMSQEAIEAAKKITFSDSTKSIVHRAFSTP